MKLEVNGLFSTYNRRSDSFFSVSATHSKCSCDSSICKDHCDDDHGPLAAIDLCLFLHSTSLSGALT